MDSRVFLSLLSAALLIEGCSIHGTPEVSTTTESEAVSAAVPAIDGGANAANAQSGAISWNDSKSTREIEDLFVEPAEASVGCGQFAVLDSCNSGQRKAVYSSCTKWGGTLTGSVTLAYSDSNCFFGTSSAQTLTRTVSLTRTGIFNSAVVTDSTNPSTAYDGTAIGAGSTLTDNGTNYSYAIAGVHKVRSLSSGASLYDVSAMTASPMTLSGALSGTRVIDGGSLVLYHNLAKYKATFTPHNLTYSSATCCHPTSGTLDVTYSGSIVGTGSISFPGACGVATLTFNKSVETVALDGCE